MKDAQHKLSKRNGDASYQDLVAKGYLPAAVLNYLLLLGWAPEGEQEIFSLDEMIKIWDPARISKSRQKTKQRFMLQRCLTGNWTPLMCSSA